FFKAVSGSRRAHQLKSLRGPADNAALAKLDEAAGGELPADYRAFLVSHDGQDGGDTIVGNPDESNELFELMSASEIADQLAWLKKSAKSMAGDFDKITADDEVKAVYWNAKWIPFAANGAGDFLCLDMAPTKRGVTGQIMLFNHEEPHR